MAPKLQHIRSDQPDKRPDPVLLAPGQLAQNRAVTSPGLFFTDAAGNLVKAGPAHVGTTAPNSSPAGSSGLSSGEQWLDTSVAPPVLRVWSGAAWVAASTPAAVPAASQTVAGIAQVATQAEVDAGTIDTDMVTPLKLRNTTAFDARYVKVPGDTMTGPLRVPNGTLATPGLQVGPGGGLYLEGSDDTLAFAAGQGTSRARMMRFVGPYEAAPTKAGRIECFKNIIVDNGIDDSINPMIDFKYGYGILTDNVGEGSSNNRMWLRGPNQGEITFGPRLGDEIAAWVRFNTTRGYFNRNLYVGQADSTSPGSGNGSTGHYFRDNGQSFHSCDTGAALFLNRNADGATANFQLSGTNCGSIRVSPNATSYVTSSDYRLKENVVALDDAADRLLQLRPVRFNFVGAAETVVDGFIAHEAQEVVPEAVCGSKDEMEDIGNIYDSDGNLIEENVPEPSPEALATRSSRSVIDAGDEGEGSTREARTYRWEKTETVPVYQGIDQGKIVPLLTAALQEAVLRIEALEAKLAA